MVIFCPACRVHEFQDERYGINRRVHNIKKDGRCICTVCLNVKSANADSLEAVKAKSKTKAKPKA